MVLGIATTGERAIELAVDLMPDIIFIDVVLTKKMDGIKAVEEINNISDATVFYLTGNTWVKNDTQLINTSFEDILIKPILHYDIIKALTKYKAARS
jgi:CheY-like chemotaxis protein